MYPESKTATLKDRAAMFKAVRSFFEARGVLEVDTPILSTSAPIDPHIDILETEALPNQVAYLHSSPEYGMKKLLAKGLSDIFQLSHVYRYGEVSSKHHIEFTMLEWYRSNFSFLELLQETQELISLFVGNLPCETVRYERILHTAHSIDPFHSSLDELRTKCHSLGLHTQSEDRDLYLSFLWDCAEPSLGSQGLLCVTHFPASQAALSRVLIEEGVAYARRFEYYYQGLELANGYHELTDPNEQYLRLTAHNEKRKSLNKKPLPIDTGFLQALAVLNSQDFFGVAVGFDRLMMLRHHTREIRDILPLSWGE